MADSAWPPAAKGYRPRCFFDVQINNVPAGRIIFEIFPDICPKTAENFRALCTGEKGEGKTTQKPLHFKGSVFHRIVKNFMIQGGDFSAGDGTGGESIYGNVFKDEPFVLKHERSYLLSMANRGPNTNGSQFFITVQAASHLDGIHVIFGHAISGFELIREIENQKTDNNHKPYADIRISNCGELVKKVKEIKHEKAKKKKKKKTRHRSSSTSSSSASESSDSASKSKRKSKKEKYKDEDDGRKRKTKHKTLESEENENLTNQETDHTIPAGPSSNFLLRRSRTPSPIRKLKSKKDSSSRKQFIIERRDDTVSKSGRRIRGRGAMRYRTPSVSPERDENKERDRRHRSHHERERRRRRSESPSKKHHRYHHRSHHRRSRSSSTSRSRSRSRGRTSN